MEYFVLALACIGGGPLKRVILKNFPWVIFNYVSANERSPKSIITLKHKLITLILLKISSNLVLIIVSAIFGSSS